MSDPFPDLPGALTTAPAWLADAWTACPTEAAELQVIAAELMALPTDAPTEAFMALYDSMMTARDRLYEAWISQEPDE